MSPSTPILPAVLTPAAPGLSAQLHVKCDNCETFHSHGADAGHRAAHCHRKESPYLATGYILDIVGEAATPDAVAPKRLLVGSGPFYGIVEAAAPKLRAALVRHLLGRTRFGRLRITVRDSGWTIDTGVTDGSRTRWINGVGLLSLFSALYGVSRGVVGVRLFEAITGEKLDALARLKIADEINAAGRRAAGASEDCA